MRWPGRIDVRMAKIFDRGAGFRFDYRKNLETQRGEPGHAALSVFTNLIASFENRSFRFRIELRHDRARMSRVPRIERRNLVGIAALPRRLPGQNADAR